MYEQMWPLNGTKWAWGRKWKPCNNGIYGLGVFIPLLCSTLVLSDKEEIISQFTHGNLMAWGGFQRKGEGGRKWSREHDMTTRKYRPSFIRFAVSTSCYSPAAL